MYSCKFAIRLPRKRKSLTVQGDFDRIIDAVRRKLCAVEFVRQISHSIGKESPSRRAWIAEEIQCMWESPA
jgi:hypothetical protein